MKAVVMAGGFGTRIQPLTNSMPKPMLPIVNKPMMEHTMMSLKALGITEFIVLLYFKPEIIKEHFKDGSHLGIKITYVVPDDDYGTAGAVKLAQEYLKDDNFIIISGDLVTDFDFQSIFDYHREKDSKLTITLTSVDNPLEFGVVIANDEGKIEKFLEKPSWGEVFSDTINTGIYVIEPEILEYIPANENYDFAKDLFPRLMHEGIDLMAGYAQGYWRDVGNPESYRDVYDDIMIQKIKVSMEGVMTSYPDGVLYAPENYMPPQSIDIIGTVVLGDNVSLHEGVKLKNVVIGNNVVVGKETKISNSVLWNDIVIDRNTILDGCVICNDNKIGKNVTAKAGMILAEGCEIGQLVKVEKDLTIWPNKMIEDAAIVSHSLVLGSRYKNSIFENGMVIGQSNVELSCEMATKLAEAFGAQLPVGSTILIARDYSRSARMLKRAFLGGLLSAGINVIDYSEIPSAILRCNLSLHDHFVAGVYFRQKLEDPAYTVITFYNHEALRINSEMAKKVEKAFFKETFRRVDYSLVGVIEESDHSKEYQTYKEGIKQLLPLPQHLFKAQNYRVAVDMMHGIASEVFPYILNDLGMEEVVFNAHPDQQRLSNIKTLEKQSNSDMSAVIKALNLDAGFILYPYGQRLDILSDQGELLGKQTSLSVVLMLLDKEAKALNKKMRVFLPTWAVDIVSFENLEIDRGKYINFKAEDLRKYDLIATGEGNFAFTEFATHRDSMYATLKIIELKLKHNVRLSDLINAIEGFYYHTFQIECSQALKGKMMRKFLEDAKGKRSSTVDGVKIWLDTHDWILMIPDQYNGHLNLYIQAKEEVRGETIYAEYQEKITRWMSEK